VDLVGNARPAVLGRETERGTLDQLLDDARNDRGEAIVLSGEPGIGKTALLEYMIASARNFKVLRTVGNEAERELPFAALQQLCAPGLTDLSQLSEPQREALRVTFGLVSGAPPDRLGPAPKTPRDSTGVPFPKLDGKRLILPD